MHLFLCLLWTWYNSHTQGWYATVFGFSSSCNTLTVSATLCCENSTIVTKAGRDSYLSFYSKRIWNSSFTNIHFVVLENPSMQATYRSSKIHDDFFSFTVCQSICGHCGHFLVWKKPTKTCQDVNFLFRFFYCVGICTQKKVSSRVIP